MEANTQKDAGVRPEVTQLVETFDLAALQALHPRDQQEFLNTVQLSLRPVYPGSDQNLAATYTPLDLRSKDRDLQTELVEFASRPPGTNEFSYADRLRSHLNDRHIQGSFPGGLIAYFATLSDKALHNAHRRHILAAAVIYELEQLPGHIAFFEEYQGTLWVENYSPRQLLASALDIAAGGRHGYIHSEEGFKSFARVIHDAVRKLPADLVLRVLKSAATPRINSAAIDEIAAADRENHPVEAEALVRASFLKILYSVYHERESVLPRWRAPASRLHDLFGCHHAAEVANLNDIAEFAFSLAKSDGRLDILQNLTSDINAGLADTSRKGCVEHHLQLFSSLAELVQNTEVNVQS